MGDLQVCPDSKPDSKISFPGPRFIFSCSRTGSYLASNPNTVELKLSYNILDLLCQDFLIRFNSIIKEKSFEIQEQNKVEEIKHNLGPLHIFTYTEATRYR